MQIHGMEAEEVKGESLTYLVLRPDDYRSAVSYPALVLFHGFGASMRDLAGICPLISRTGYLYVCPNAPYPIDFGDDQVGYSWSLPRSEGSGAGPPIDEEALDAFFAELRERYGIDPGRTVILGFSQGSGLVLRYGLPRRDAPFAGLIALSGGLRDAEELKARLPDDRSLPIHIGHGFFDQVVAVDRSRQTRAFLEEQGYRPFYKEYRMGHQISMGEQLDDIIAWLREVLPPLES